jgi:hypothetical protein
MAGILVDQDKMQLIILQVVALALLVTEYHLQVVAVRVVMVDQAY